MALSDYVQQQIPKIVTSFNCGRWFPCHDSHVGKPDHIKGNVDHGAGMQLGLVFEFLVGEEAGVILFLKCVALYLVYCNDGFI